MYTKTVFLVSVFLCQAYGAPFDFFLSAVPNMVGQGIRQFQDFMDRGQAYGQQFQDFMKEQMYDNVKKGQDMFGGMSQRFNAQSKNSMAQGEKLMKDFQNSMANSQKFAEGLASQMQDRFDATTKDNRKMASDIQNQFKQQFEDAQNKGNEYVNDFLKQTQAQMDDLRNQGKTFSTDLENQMAQGQETADRLGAEFQQNLQGAYNQGKQMMAEGQNLMEGVAKEMSKQGEEAVGNLEKVNNEVNAQILAALKP